MRTLFLAPHADDETLFGAFTLIREKPLVIICTTDGNPQRRHESLLACAALGCQRETWAEHEASPRWNGIEDRLRAFNPATHVYAPEPELYGNPQHNAIGQIAARVFRNVTHYLTYTSDGKSTNGQLAPYEPPWIGLKLRALACYESQFSHPSHAPHFVRGLEEFYAI